MCVGTQPPELDSNRLKLLRDPSAVNSVEGQNVVATGGNGAEFVLVMGEHSCFENDSVGVGDGHI